MSATIVIVQAGRFSSRSQDQRDQRRNPNHRTIQHKIGQYATSPTSGSGCGTWWALRTRRRRLLEYVRSLDVVPGEARAVRVQSAVRHCHSESILVPCHGVFPIRAVVLSGLCFDLHLVPPFIARREHSAGATRPPRSRPRRSRAVTSHARGYVSCCDVQECVAIFWCMAGSVAVSESPASTTFRRARSIPPVLPSGSSASNDTGPTSARNRLTPSRPCAPSTGRRKPGRSQSARRVRSPQAGHAASPTVTLTRFPNRRKAWSMVAAFVT